MKKAIPELSPLLVLLLMSVTALAQQGPGGVGTRDGASLLRFWGQAGQPTDSLNAAHEVLRWTNLSGNGRHALSASKPPALSGSINGWEALYFSGSDFLNIAQDPALPAFTCYWVARSSGSGSGTLMGSQSPNSPGYVDISLNNTHLPIVSLGSAQATFTSPVPASGAVIGAVTWNGSTLGSRVNGVRSLQTFATGTGPLAAADRKIGSNGDLAHFFTGHLAEYILFDQTLNLAQHTLVENYLQARYRIAIANDRYTEPAGYSFDVAGIGRELDGSHGSAASAGLTVSSATGSPGFLRNPGDYLLIGHNLPAAAGYIAEHLSGLSDLRWSREWYLDLTDAMQTGGAVSLRFDESDAGLSQALGGASVLLYRDSPSGEWQELSTAGLRSGDAVTFTLDASALKDGIYTLGRLRRSGSGNALIFNGNSDFVQATGITYPAAGATIELWFRSTGAGQGLAPLFAAYQGGNVRAPGVFTAGNTLSWEFGSTSNQGSSVRFSPNEWHHLAFTYEKTGNTYKIRILLDGQTVIKADNLPDPGAFPALFQAGSWAGQTGHFFEGEIDEIRIWSVARDEAGIRDCMCRRVGAGESGLYSAWRLDEAETVVCQNETGAASLSLPGNATRTSSGAPIGDASAWLYPVAANWSGQELSLNGAGGFSASVSAVQGLTEGVVVWYADYPGQTMSQPGYESAVSEIQWGVHATGSADSTAFMLRFAYPEEAFADQEPSLRLATRTENGWYHSGASQDRENHRFSLPGAAPGQSFALAGRKYASAARPGPGKALRFSQSQAYVSSPLTLASDQSFTIEAWIQPAAFTQSPQTILDANRRVWIYLNESGHLAVSHHSQGNISLSALKVNTWNHIAYVYDAGSGKGTIFINGLFSGRWSITQGVQAAVGPLYAGKNGFGAGVPFSGEMDDLRVWQAALSDSLLHAWMCRKPSASHPSYAQLSAWYPFDEEVTSSDLLEDRAGWQDARAYGMNLLSDRKDSGAPLGDEAVHIDFPAPGSTLRLSHPDGDYVQLSEWEGVALPEVVCLYRVNEASHANFGRELSLWSDRRYWGLWMPGASEEVSYRIEMGYQGYPSFSSEAGLTMASRENPAELTWENDFGLLDMENQLIGQRLGGSREVILGEGIPLAAGWLDIGAFWEGEGAQITWATSWEEQADYFEVERSGDGSTFEAVGRVPAVGQSRERTAYRFEDQGPAEAPASGRVYYRVRQTGTDGRTALSEQVELPWRALGIRLQLSPNPFVEVLDIETSGTRSAEMYLRICDAGGRVLASQVLAAGEERCQFYLEGLEPGIYFFEARCENWQEHRKLIRK